MDFTQADGVAVLPPSPPVPPVDIDPEVDEAPDVVPNAGNRRPGSLAARMQARHEDIAAAKTERFDVPGYGEFLQVELRAIPFEQSASIAIQHQRVGSLPKRIIRIQTDILSHAFQAFYAYTDDEGNSEMALQDSGEPETWKSLYVGAQREAGNPIPPEVAEKMTARAAITYFLGAEKIGLLSSQYEEWRGSGGVQGDLEKKLLGEASTTRS